MERRCGPLQALPVHRPLALQLRLEVYNLFNHANLYVNDAEAAIDCGTMITAYRGYTDVGGLVGDGQRRIQLAAKLEF